MEELKPCPFEQCRGGAESYQNGDAEGVWFGVECTRCGCAITGFNTRLQAEQAWNTRATDPLLEKMARALKAVDEFASGYHWAIQRSLRDKVKQSLQEWEATCNEKK